MIVLDVGGILYSTSMETLSRYPNSTIYELAQSHSTNEPMFIDRDGAVFGIILNFMRQGCLIMSNDATVVRFLMIEAEYYRLPELRDALLRMPQETDLYTEIRLLRQALTRKSEGKSFRKRDTHA